jgi:hypothetical protein
MIFTSLTLTVEIRQVLLIKKEAIQSLNSLRHITRRLTIRHLVMMTGAT